MSVAVPEERAISPAPPLLQALREATRDHHARLERRLPLTAPGFSLAWYRAVLAAFFGFYRPLEERVGRVIGPLPDLDWASRRKLPLLERDLLALGIDRAGVAALPLCRDLPAPADAAGALGRLYVVEGATLGGRVMSRHLRGRLGLEPESGAAFFAGYGESTGLMWRRFVDALERAAPRLASTRVTVAAVATFAAIERWLASRGVLV